MLPTTVLGLPPASFESPRLDPAALPAGSMIRVALRTYLVRDLDTTLSTVARLLGWRSQQPVETSGTGARRARLGFRLANSTRLELLQPGPGSEEAEALDEWGDGPWSMTIGVHGLEAKATDLDQRGTAYRWVETEFAAPGRVIRIPREATPGCGFDLAEISELHDPREP